MPRMKIVSTESGSCRELFGYEEGHLVVAETKQGELYVLREALKTAAQAERVAARVQRNGTINPEHWHYWRVRYGSEAYLAQTEELWMMQQAGAREEDLPDELRTLA